MSDDVPEPTNDGHDPIQLRLPPGLTRLGVASRGLALASVAVVAATVVTAAIALASGDDGDGDGQRARPAAQQTSDDSYRTPVGDLLGSGDYPVPALSGDTGQQGVPAGTSPRPTVPRTATTPASDTRIVGYGGGSGTMTPAGIATLAMSAGCSDGAAVTATAVAIAESGGSPSAQGDTTLMDATWDWSAGLWQIRGLKAQRNTGELRDSIANHDPATNAKAMYAISSSCSNWGPWTTYTRGTYESFLAIARRAVAYVQQYRRSHGGQLPPVAAPDPNAPIPAGDGSGGTGNPPASGAGNAVARPGRTTTPSSGAPQPGGTTAPPARGGGTGSSSPSSKQTSQPTSRPTSSTTRLPTTLPRKLPTLLPTTLPTRLPTLLPTKLPTLLPTKLPLP